MLYPDNHFLFVDGYCARGLKLVELSSNHEKTMKIRELNECQKLDLN
jgi:hypothetical protein